MIKSLFHCNACTLDFMLDLIEHEVKFCPLCAAPDPLFIQNFSEAEADDRAEALTAEEIMQKLRAATAKLDAADPPPWAGAPDPLPPDDAA
jgi:hypothetical protein